MTTSIPQNLAREGTSVVAIKGQGVNTCVM